MICLMRESPAYVVFCGIFFRRVYPFFLPFFYGPILNGEKDGLGGV